ncbi:IS3 family transposase [Flammeovirga sp. OC4]|uniref:IS3 family transposase n=1 Tax=Flammeovirga sp. OC4 TaxID=1382345 RepID=UPI0009E25969|nr:IS3 family transposase [Flammeovirga sp. OC4]
MADHKYYYSFAQARNDIFEFIEVWYNKKRIHSVLGYKSSEQFMKLYNRKVA